MHGTAPRLRTLGRTLVTSVFPSDKYCYMLCYVCDVLDECEHAQYQVIVYILVKLPHKCITEYIVRGCGRESNMRRVPY